MTTPTALSDDDAKKNYLALCLKMTHAQLYAELMRVHKEATNLVQQAVEHERNNIVKAIEQYVDNHDWEYKEFGLELAEFIKGDSNGNHP